MLNALDHDLAAPAGRRGRGGGPRPGRLGRGGAGRGPRVLLGHGPQGAVGGRDRRGLLPPLDPRAQLPRGHGQARGRRCSTATASAAGSSSPSPATCGSPPTTPSSGLGATRHGLDPRRLDPAAGPHRRARARQGADAAQRPRRRRRRPSPWAWSTGWCRPAAVDATPRRDRRARRSTPRAPPPATPSGCSTRRSTRDPRDDDRGGDAGPARLHDVVGDRGGQPGLGREAGGALLSAARRPAPERVAGGRRPSPGRPSDVILETEGLTKEFRGFVAVNDVDLRVRRGTIHALIGPNGAGKTTCFNLLTHFLAPTRGRIRFNGRDITGSRPADIARLGLVRSFQISAVFPHLTVLENVRIALQRRARALLRLLALGARCSTRSTSARAGAARRGRPRGLRGDARRRAALRAQARARDRHHARARSGDDAARRADRGHGARGRRAHLGADPAGRGEPHRADGRAQPERGGAPLRHHHGARPRRGARRGRLRRPCRAIPRSSRPTWARAMAEAGLGA